MGWTQQQYEENIEDLEEIFLVHYSRVFNKNTRFILKNKDMSKYRGLNIITSRGNVVVIDVSTVDL